MATDYLIELCIPATVTEHRATLRSALLNTGRLALPTRSTNTKFGDRALRAAGPTALNTLPVSINNRHRWNRSRDN